MFMLPDLPYPSTALEPYVSAQTLSYHHGKHHQTYVDNLNKLIAGTPLEGKDLETIIQETSTDPSRMGIFNNAAQVWNHTFYWKSLKKNGGGKPSGQVLARLAQDFGSYENFRAAFKDAALTQFGSGWAWLVEEKGVLKVVKTGNADLPLIHGQKPLVTCDVWEHAYYLDYQNARVKYVETFLDHLINWDFVAENMGL